VWLEARRNTFSIGHCLIQGQSYRPKDKLKTRIATNDKEVSKES
jgi:hypothetical protein